MDSTFDTVSGALETPSTPSIQSFHYMYLGERRSYFDKLLKFLKRNKISISMNSKNVDNDTFNLEPDRMKQDDIAKKLFITRDVLAAEHKFIAFWQQKYGTQDVTLELLQKELQFVGVVYSGKNLFIARSLLISFLPS